MNLKKTIWHLDYRQVTFVLQVLFIFAILAQQPEICSAQSSSKTTSKLDKAFDVEYLPDEGGVVFAIKVAEILKEKRFASLVEAMNTSPSGPKPSDIEEFLFSMKPDEQRPAPNSIVRLTKQGAEKSPEKFMMMSSGERETIEYRDEKYEVFKFGETVISAMWQPDSKTIVNSTPEFIEKSISRKTLPRTLLKSNDWEKIEESMIALALDKPAIGFFIKELEGGRPNPFVTMLSPISESVTTAFMSADLAKEKIEISGTIYCEDSAGAKDAEKGLNAVLQLGKGMIGLSRNQVPPEMRGLIDVGVELIDSIKIKRSGKKISFDGKVSLKSIKGDPFASAIGAAKLAAQRTQSMNNGRQCALAFHNYVDAMGKFPQAVLKGPKGHQYSWRVAILPFIEQQELYDQYNFEEDWDSENNLKVMKKMPPVFRHPSQPDDSYDTSYLAVSGPDTIFWGDEAISFKDLTDGSSNTILFVEAKSTVPWTKPQDLDYDPEKGLPKFGGFSDGGFNAVFADGSVQFISDKVEEEMMHNMLQKSDGNIIKR